MKSSCLHIDFDKSRVDPVASDIYRWILERDIAKLNVAGPRASTDPRINEAVRHTIEEVIRLSQSGS